MVVSCLVSTILPLVVWQLTQQFVIVQELKLLPTPADAISVARFLKTCPALDKELVGTYLSYPKDVPKYEFHTKVRKAFMQTFDFKGFSIVEALRSLLDYFRLPGEAQKIEVIVEEFADVYYGSEPGPMAEADTAFILAYSIIMLNTDLHNPSVQHKMTTEQFLRNNRGINKGQDLPQEFLIAIYNEIKEKISFSFAMTFSCLLYCYFPNVE